MTYHFVYAGIGSRETPSEFCELMSRVARYLEKKGGLLRSGAAPGADTAFEQGVENPRNMQIFVPWNGFNGTSHRAIPFNDVAVDIARAHHPRYDALSDPVKKLMNRNTYQVVDVDGLTLADFILCWTEGGTGKGGTGQALRIAKTYDIPVFDMGRYPTAEAARRPLYEFLKGIDKIGVLPVL